VPKPFNLLAELASFGAERRLSLRDPALKDAFGVHVSSSVDQALSDDILLHGQRTEAMFEALLVSLGEFRLFKAEDGGRVHSAEGLRVPDFRVVLADGEQWLIEVKNVYEEDPLVQRRLLMKRDYRQALEAYAEATGAKLKLAVFWARWSIWTLVSPDRLADEDGDLVLDMNEAVIANELGRLGDRTIGTRAPLRLRFTADPERTSAVGEDGEVTITFNGWQLLCGEDLITDPVEKKIAMIFLEHGEWECDGPLAVIDDGRLAAVEFRWDPVEPTGQGFEFIGSLSRMFARYYAGQTVKDRSIVQLRAPFRPGWFAPLIRADHVSDAMPLWRFTLQPSYRAGVEA
jgi:hypothetical protein